MNESNELMKLKTDNDITILFNNKISIDEVLNKLIFLILWIIIIINTFIINFNKKNIN